MGIIGKRETFKAMVSNKVINLIVVNNKNELIKGIQKEVFGSVRQKSEHL